MYTLQQSTVIVDGNHRYVAGKVYDQELVKVPLVKPVRKTTVSPVDWGNK